MTTPATPIYPFVFTDITTADGLSYRGGYCSTGDVKMFLFNIDNDSRLSVNNILIETVIADVAADLDRALGLLYRVPITGSLAVQHMNMINKHMAIAGLLMLSANGSAVGVEAVHTNSMIHHETGSQRLDDIVRGVTQLFDAVTLANGERSSFPAGIAARWNPDVDPGILVNNPQATGPLFGTRYDPAYKDADWIY